MVRTLPTQMRLRRLVRLHQEAVERIQDAPGDGRVAAAARSRLLDAMTAVRAAWTADTAAAGELPALRRHVARSLARMETAILATGRRNGDIATAVAEFRDAALPLLFSLRGLESLPDLQIQEWTGASPVLARSA